MMTAIQINPRFQSLIRQQPTAYARCVLALEILEAPLKAIAKERMRAGGGNRRGKGTITIRPSAIPRKGYVYFAQSGDLFKIGFSKDPLSRIKQLQNHNPNLVLMGYIAGNTLMEKCIQKEFAPCHYKGEWFAMNAAAALTIQHYLSRISHD